MLSCLFKSIDWSQINNVLFDMDGTLYDEYDFIEQAYSSMCELLPEDVRDFMLQRWMEMGSSYNNIFSETYDKFSYLLSGGKELFVSQCLMLFRNFDPVLKLSGRTEFILKHMKTRYELFLISDGNPGLQRKKFKALGLENFFSDCNVVFTGSLPKGEEKPNTRFFKMYNIDNDKTLYFGDREVDSVFASINNIKFIKVYNMIEAK